MNDFIDIDPEFKLDPRSGDVQTVVDGRSIQKSIVGLVQTYIFDRPFEPRIRSSVSDLEFLPAKTGDPMAGYMYETAIGEVINRYEPRALFENADVSFTDRNTIYIRVTYRIVNDPETPQSTILRLPQ